MQQNTNISFTFSKYCTGCYGFGFNGKEKDAETYGEGNEYDYGFRIYNPRIGKFLSVDPLAAKFPFYTPYQFSGNKPISCLDLDGLEDIYYLDPIEEKNGNAIMDLLTSTEIGAQIINEFKNTDPSKGEVNKGYDVYLRAVSTSEMISDQMKGGVVNFAKKDATTTLFAYGYKQFPLLEEIIKSREDKNGLDYNHFVRVYGEAFVNNPNLENTLKNGRGFIIVGIPSGAKYAADLKRTAAAVASTTGHEFLNHVNEISQTEEMPTADRIDQQHIENTGRPEGAAGVGSKQDQLNKQIDKKVE